MQYYCLWNVPSVEEFICDIELLELELKKINKKYIKNKINKRIF